jgi:hypothetical protein
MFLVLSAMMHPSEAVSSTDDTQDYYSSVCASLRNKSQLMHTAGEAFDQATDESLKSTFWDQYQVAQEQRERLLQQHRANVSWQASMGNLPPRGSTCLL